MDSIESFVKLALNGKPINDREFCDFSLEDQLAELIRINNNTEFDSQISTKFTPKIQQNIHYIVAAVIFNEHDELLMMQEAKQSCAGTWYLPAGRVNADEDLIPAVKREVLEETGLNFEPTTLLQIESGKGCWYRFVFTGKITGGELKTPLQADAESIQAQWIDDIKQLDLRHNDILDLIEKGKQYYKRAKEERRLFLPALVPHQKMLLRLVLIIRKKENNRVHVLVSERESTHLPACEINPNKSVHASLKRFMNSIFKNLPEHKPIAILSAEHSGQPKHEHDGLCLTYLVMCKPALEDAIPGPDYLWMEVDKEVEDLVLKVSSTELKTKHSMLKQH